MKTFRLLIGLILIVSSSASFAIKNYGTSVTCESGDLVVECASAIGVAISLQFRGHAWVWEDHNYSQYILEFVGTQQARVTYVPPPLPNGQPNGSPTVLGTYYAYLVSGSGERYTSSGPTGIMEMRLLIDGQTYPIRLQGVKPFSSYSAHDGNYQTCLMLPGTSHYNCHDVNFD